MNHANRIENKGARVVEIRTGRVVRNLCTGHAVHGEISGEFANVTTDSGRVECYEIRTGRLVRRI